MSSSSSSSSRGPDALEEVLDRAIERRRDLQSSADADCYRLFHGWTEGWPRLEIDRWADVVTIEARDTTADIAARSVPLLAERLSPRSIVLEVRGREPRVVHGEVPGRVVVREAGLRFAVEPLRPRNPGLHLDARPARQWLRGASEGRRVLNLFAFTGSLGLAASAGGARRVAHVDMQKSALSRVRANYRLNGLSIDDRDLVRVNIYQHLRRASARRQRYDGIIVDAPPYVPHKDRTPGGRGVHAIARHASAMLAEGGWMLCFFHHLMRPRGELETEVIRAAEVPLEVIWRGQSGSDFPEDQPERKSRMTAFQMVA